MDATWDWDELPKPRWKVRRRESRRCRHTECRGGLLPLGRASLAATVLPLEASNTEIRQSLLDGSLGLGPPEGGARDRRRERRCAACVGWRGVPLGGERL